MNNKTVLQYTNTLINTVVLCLLAVLLLKLVFVFGYSSREYNYGYPYDSMVFDPFHRFTDWLIGIEWSRVGNPYDLNNELYKHIPPAPMSILSFWMLRFCDFINKYFSFFIILSFYVYANYKLFKLAYPSDDWRLALLVFLSSCVSTFPLWFVVDRGNPEIFGLILISLLLFKSIQSKCFASWVSLFLVAFLVSLKPSWGMYGMLLFLFPLRKALVGLLVCVLVYAYPVLFMGMDVFYLTSLIKLALPYIKDTNTWCSNITCAVRSLPLSININNYLVAGVVVFLTFVSSLYVLFKVKLRKEFLLIVVVSIGTVLANNPSPDYRLNIFFPITLGFICVFDTLRPSKLLLACLLISSVLVLGFINIPIKGFFPYTTLLRFIGVLGFLFVTYKVCCAKKMSVV